MEGILILVLIGLLVAAYEQISYRDYIDHLDLISKSDNSTKCIHRRFRVWCFSGFILLIAYYKSTLL